MLDSFDAPDFAPQHYGMLPRSFTPFRSLFLGKCVFLALSVHASLQWETTKLELTAKLSDKSVPGVFSFKNTGKTAVTVTHIETSCECTTANLDQRVYAPGESGEIHVFFRIGGQTGRQEKTIEVITDDTSSPLTSLTLSVNVSEVISYNSRMVLWRVGETLSDKSIDITILDGDERSRLEINPPAGSVTARLEEIHPRLYRVTVRPLSTSQAAAVVIPCKVLIGHEPPYEFPLYALIK